MLDIEKKNESKLQNFYNNLEKQFACLQDELDSIIDNMPSGVLVLDSKGNVQKCNDMAFEILRIKVVSKNWRTCLSEELVKYIKAPNVYALRNSKVVKITEKTLSNKKTLVSIIDVTEHVTAKRVIKNREKLAEIGEMMAKLSHQLKTPLSAAILYASDLKDCKLTNEKQKKYTGKLYERLEYLNNLVDDVLKMVKTNQIEFSNVNISDIIKQVKESVKALFKQNDKFIIKDECLDSSVIRGNLYQLSNMLVNLIENSVQACLNDAIVSLNVLKHEKIIEFIIEDNGKGIRDDNLNKVSTAFYTTKIAGTGLGMSIVKNIVEKHKGKMIIKSENGNGTKIHILIPRGSYEF